VTIPNNGNPVTLVAVAGEDLDIDVGTINMASDGSYTFTPNENYNGEVPTITYTTNTGATGTLDITVDAVNDAVDAGDVDLGATLEDNAITFSGDDLLSNSSDIDGDNLSITEVSVDAQYGTLVDNGDDTYTFTPTENYNGDDVAFSFTVSDGTTTDSATATLDVTAVNDGPVATDDSTISSGNGSVELPGVASQGFVQLTQPDPDVLVYDLNGAVEGDTVTIDVANTFVSDSASWSNSVGMYFADENGKPITGKMIFEDSKDGTTNASETVSMTVPEGAVSVGFFLAPDAAGLDRTDISDGNEITFYSDHSDIWGARDNDLDVTDSGTYLATRGENDSFVFSDNTLNSDDTQGFFVQDDGSFSVEDGGGGNLDLGIKVTEINAGVEDPNSIDITGQIGEGETHDYPIEFAGGTLTIDTATEFAGYGENWVDLDGDGVKEGVNTVLNVYDEDGNLVATNDSSGSWGSTTAESMTDGGTSHLDAFISIDLPAGNYTVQVDIKDEGLSGPYKLSISGDNAVGIVGGTQEVAIETEEDTALTITADSLLANDTDVDGDTLTITEVNATDATHGTVSLDSDGNVVFTPEDNYNGEASFTYTVSDGNGGTDTATVTLNVTSVNDLPEIDIQSTANVNEDGTLTINANNFSVSDVEDDSVTTTVTATNGTVSIIDGNIVYTPNENYNGSDTITVTATDSDGGVTTEDIAVTVNAVNDAITQVSDTDSATNTIDENVADGTYTGVTLSATDADGDAITYSLPEDVPFRVEADGRIVVDGDNAIDYETDSSFSFTATATSADGTSTTVPVTINVNDIDEVADGVNLDIEVTSANVETTVSSGPQRLEDIESVDTTVSGDNVQTFSNMNSAYYAPQGDNDDVIEVNGNSNTIATYDGDDTINVDGAQNAAIDAGEGNNRIDIDGNSNSIYVGDGDDAIRVGQSMNAGIDLNDGNNILDVAGNANNIYSGSGDDTILVGGHQNGNIGTGAGNDYVEVGGNSNSTDLGAGDDFMKVGGTVNSNIYAGDGNDSIELSNYTQTMWDQNYNGIQSKVGSFENIKLGDGSVIKGDESAFDNVGGSSETTYETTLSITATQNDTDETLSNVTIDVPADVTVKDADGNELTVTDGQVSVPVSSGVETSITIVSSDELTPSELNAISGSVTTTEVGGDFDTATDTIGSDISQVEDSDITTNAIDENVADGTYTGVTLSATDADGDAITYSLPDNVPFSIDENGQIVTDGAIDFETTQSYTFDVTATSADGTTSTESITISVNDLVENVDPEAQDDSITIVEDNSITINPDTLLANDTDGDNDSLTITSVQDATNGTVSIDGDGNIVFTPDTNFSGDANFTYTVSDGNGGTSTATATVSVTADADTPVDLSVDVSRDADSVVIDSGTNAIVGDDLSSVSTVEGVEYDLSFNYSGDEVVNVYYGDTLVGTVDGSATSDSTHTFSVEGLPADAALTFKDADNNDIADVSEAYMAPTESMIEYNVDISASLQDTDGSESLSFTLSGLPDGTTLSAGEAGAEAGTWTIDADDVADLTIYVPESADTFDLSVTATATDSNGDTATTTAVSAEVTDVSLNDAATSTDDSVSAVEDTTLTLSVNDFGGYSDTDGDDFTAVMITDLPENGTLKLLGQDNPNTPDGSVEITEGMDISVSDINLGNLVFVPDTNFSGDTAFDFRVSDGNSFSEDSYTTTVNVEAVADAPEISLQIGTAVQTTIPGSTTTLEPIVDNDNNLSSKSFNSFDSNENVEEGSTTTKTFDFGDEYAGETVTLSFTTDIHGSDWEGSDSFVISANGSELETLSENNNLNGDASHSYSVTLDDEGKAEISMSQINGGNTRGDESVEVENFSIEYSGSDNGWSGSGVSESDGELTIGQDNTATQTFNFGAENAGQEVTITFDGEFSGGWSTHGVGDKFFLNVNGTNVETKTDFDTDYSDSEIDYGTFSQTAIVQPDGTVTVEMSTDTTRGQEVVTIKNFNIEGVATEGDVIINEYPINIDAQLTDDSESLSDITVSGIPADATLYVGDTQISVDDGVAVLTPEQASSDDISLSLPSTSDQNFTLDVSVTSTESSNNDSVTSTASAEHLDIDDAPELTDENITVEVGGDAGVASQDTNIVMVLDLSGSMSRDGDLDTEGTQSRLEIAKDAIEDMITAYDDLGDVNVQLTTFSSTGTTTSWMSAEDAIDTIDSLSAGGYTNYEDALQETYTNYEPTGTPDQTVGFFISDGEPTRENTEGRDVRGNVGQDAEDGWIDSSYLSAWTDFVNDNLDELNVIGIGNGISNTTYLDQLAEGMNSSVTVNTMHVVDVTELSENITPNVNVVEGSISDNIDYGADGEGAIESITIDGNTYTADTFPDAGVTTTNGAKVTFDFETGDYTYTAVSTAAADFTETFEVAVSDADGDISTMDINVTTDVDETPQVPADETYNFRNADDTDSSSDYNDRTLTTDSGDDTITATGHIEDGVVITTNEGNDTINFGGDLGDESDTSTTTVNMGAGDDTLQGTGDDSDITGAAVDMGDGNNTINVDDIKENATVTTGSGDDTITMDDIRSGATVNTGEGNDTITGQGDHSEISDATVDTGLGDDSISVGQIDGTSDVDMGDGADTLTVDDYIGGSANVDTGDGDDTLDIERLQDSASITTGSGDDTMTVNDVSSGFDTGSVDLGAGNDTLTIHDTLDGTDGIFNAGEGVDNLILTNVSQDDWDGGIKDQFTGFESVTFSDGSTLDLTDTVDAPTLTMDIGDEEVISSGGGEPGVDQASTGTDNTISTNIWNWDHNVTTNGTDADDTINYTRGENQTINGGDGDDNITTSTNDWTHGLTIDGGAGNDYIVANKGGDEWDSSKSVTVDGGTGDDTISFNAGAWDYVHGANVDGGAGDDKIYIAQKGNNSVIDGGADNDTAVLSGSKSDYQITNNSDGSITVTRTSDWQLKNVTIKNVENLEFSSGETMSLSGSSTSTSSSSDTYEYDITLNAGLTDTDGSESLSDMTLTNIPSGATLLDSNGDEITPDANGVYNITMDSNGDATVTLSSTTSIDATDLDAITATVTSTESTDNETSTVSTNDDADLSAMGDIVDGEFTFDDTDFDLNFDNLDMSDTSLSDINTIDMSSGSHEISNIDVSDVMDMTGTDNSLTILGGADDEVSLDTDTWTKGETTTDANGNEVTSYTGSGTNNEEIELLIDTSITVHES
jgi:hypothetical protein